MTSAETNLKKFEELYVHAKYVLDEESKRNTRIEDKASKQLTITISLFALYALIGRSIFPEFFPLQNGINALMLFLAAAVVICLFFSGLAAYKCVRIQGVTKAPLNKDILDFFEKTDLIDIYYSMASKYSEALNENRDMNNRKAAKIETSYRFFFPAIVFFILFSIFSVIDFNSKSEASAAKAQVDTIQTQIKKD